MNILVIDTGTSSMRGILFDRNGRILTICQNKYFMEVSDSRTAEQDASSFKESLIHICSTIAKEAKIINKSIDGLSLTSQRSSILPIDRFGNPLSPVIMWYDKRSQDVCDAINEKAGDYLYDICGMKAMPSFSAPKMKWLKENRTDVYKKSYKLIGIHDYLLYLLTGQFVTDTSLASRTCLLNVRTCKWSQELIDLFELDGTKLCDLIPVGSQAGTVTEDFSYVTGLRSGIPVITGGGDQQCSALGQMLTQKNQVGITSGTASYVVAITEEPIFDPERRVNLNVSAQEGKWILEASNMSSGAVYNWFRELMYDECSNFDMMNEEISKSLPGAHGLIMLPDLTGKGCPHWDGFARGSFFNIGFETTKSDFSRAVLEGIASEVAECFYIIQQVCGQIEKVTSTGGLAKFSLFNQMIADMINEQVVSCNLQETTAIGAWAIAAKALGLYDNAEAALQTQLKPDEVKQVLFPNQDNYMVYNKSNQARNYLRNSIDNKKVCEILNQ